MELCAKCKQKFGMLEYKNKLKDGRVMCHDCYNQWQEEEEQKEEKLAKEKEEAKLKKALSKNPKWEYKVVQVNTSRSGFVATDAKIKNIDEALNKLGEEGWELVSVVGLQAISGGMSISAPGTTTSVAFVFKRRI